MKKIKIIGYFFFSIYCTCFKVPTFVSPKCIQFTSQTVAEAFSRLGTLTYTKYQLKSEMVTIFEEMTESRKVLVTNLPKEFIDPVKITEVGAT